MEVEDLKLINKAVGFRQVVKCLNSNTVCHIILAVDSDEDFKNKVKKVATVNGVSITEIGTKSQIAKACGVDKSVAVVGVIK